MMQNAEQETRHYNMLVKEQEAIEASRKEAEERQKAEEQKKAEEEEKKRKASAGKVRSSQSSGKRHNKRSNV